MRASGGSHRYRYRVTWWGPLDQRREVLSPIVRKIGDSLRAPLRAIGADENTILTVTKHDDRMWLTLVYYVVAEDGAEVELTARTASMVLTALDKLRLPTTVEWDTANMHVLKVGLADPPPTLPELNTPD
jgi:hypothetical protein